MNKERLIVIIAIVAMVVFSAGAGAVVHADGNTSDTTYTFNNTASSGQTYYRNKMNDTKIYIHPENGLEIYYAAFGCNNTNGNNEYQCSDTVAIGIGVYASLTNYVNEWGYAFARLKFYRKIGSPVNINTTGVWSPDSTQNYTVYGN